MLLIDWKKHKVLEDSKCTDFHCDNRATHILEAPNGHIFYECHECATRKAKEYRDKLKETWKVIKPNKYTSNGNTVLGYPVKNTQTKRKS